MKGKATRDRILEAAKNLFAEKGYHATAMDAIAQEAGVSKGSLYWHFKSKDDLFVEMIKKEGGLIIKEIQELNGPGKSASLVLKEFITARLKQMLHRQKANQLFMNNEFLKQSSFLKGVLLELSVQIVRELEKVIQQGIEQGEFRQLPPRETAMALLGSISGLRLEIITYGCNDLEARVNLLLDLLLKGMLAREGGSND